MLDRVRSIAARAIKPARKPTGVESLNTKKQKSPRPVQLAEFETAITAALAAVGTGCTTATILDRLFNLAPDGATLEFDGKPPVTADELSQAIEELSAEELDLSADVLRTLKHTQALIATAEKRDAAKAGEPPQYVTRSEFDALRTAYALTLAQLVSCVTNSMYSPSRYIASLDDVCSEQAAPVKKEVAKLVQKMGSARTVDIAANRRQKPSHMYQPGFIRF